MSRSPSRWTPRFHRELPNLAVLDVPGFGLDRLATALFLAVAVPVGLAFRRRTSAYVGMKLASPALAAAVCGITGRRPFLAVATTSGPQSEASHLLAGGVGSRVRRNLLGRARFLVAQQETAARELSQLITAERVAIVPTPVEVPALSPLTGEPRVVYTGRLARDKDLPGLVRAWKLVADRHPDARLTLVGAAGRHEPFEAEIRQTVAHDPVLSATVRFTGWVDDVAPLLAASDVFVLPSLGKQEGMSNALLEACAWGRVIVASDIPANRAVLGDGYPLLFPPGNAGRLAELLERALCDERLRAACSSAVRERAARFTVDSVVDRFEHLVTLAGASLCS